MAAVDASELEALDALHDKMDPIAAAEGGPMFRDRPDRWWEAHTFRCRNVHVSTRLLLTDRGDVCLAGGCRLFTVLTFPEDIDGPLVAPAVQESL